MTDQASLPVPDEQGELALYHLHHLLFTTQAELNPTIRAVRPDIAQTLCYLAAKEPVRAALVRQSLSLAASLISQAAALVNEAIDWPSVEALFCPAEDIFLDSPQSWLVVGHACAGQPNGAPVPATQEQQEQPAAPPPPISLSPVEAGQPPAPTKAALRRHGRTLRDECETEKRRFYAIAHKRGLPTGPIAGDAIRRALSQLFEMPLDSRKDLTARQWSQAASALDTEDLHWEVAPLRPLKATPKPTPRASQNGHQPSLRP